MNNKSPAFQFYPADWLSDMNVATMTDQEEGIYIRLLSYCWIHGSIPGDIEKIKRLLKNGSNHDVTTLEPVLKCFKLDDDGNYIHGRLEKERQKQEEHREKSSRGGKISAEIRENNRKNQQNKQNLKGGTPLVEDGLPPKSNTMSLSSSSSSSSSSSKINPRGPFSKKEKQDAFEIRFITYPGQQDGKKWSNDQWDKSIKTQDDIDLYDIAFKKYTEYVEGQRYYGFPEFQYKHAKNWFNDWKDYIPGEAPPPEPEKPPDPPKPRPPTDTKLEKLWSDCLEMVETQVSAESYLSFETTFPRSLENSTLLVAVPNQITRKRMIENYREMIELFLKEVSGKSILVDFCILKG